MAFSRGRCPIKTQFPSPQRQTHFCFVGLLDQRPYMTSEPWEWPGRDKNPLVIIENRTRIFCVASHSIAHLATAAAKENFSPR